MNAALKSACPRSLRVMADTSLWPARPFLPLVRRRDRAEDELGVLFDALGAVGLAGHKCTVLNADYRGASNFQK